MVYQKAAFWNKLENNFTKVLLVSFRETITSYVTIPGEQAKIPVSAYKTEGQICKKFQNFYNSEKHCAEEITSAKFREEGHRPDNRAFQVVVQSSIVLANRN